VELVYRRAAHFKALRQTIKKLPTTIYRAKGIVNLADIPDRRSVLQMVGSGPASHRRRMGRSAAAHADCRDRLTCGVDGDDLQRRFEACYGNPSDSGDTLRWHHARMAARR